MIYFDLLTDLMGKPLPTQKKLCSIWLESEIGYGGRDKLKMFFCFNCKIPVVQYSGDVITVVPGALPYQPATVHKCKGSVQSVNGGWEECGMFYSFMAVTHTANPELT